LALVFAPNGDLLTSNGDAVNADPTQPSEIVEFIKKGEFIGQFNVDQAEGGAFGIVVNKSDDNSVRLAAVDDVGRKNFSAVCVARNRVTTIILLALISFDARIDGELILGPGQSKLLSTIERFNDYGQCADDNGFPCHRVRGRMGRNGRYALGGMLRQSVFGRGPPSFAISSAADRQGPQ
jgi:hypothetical protein